MRYARHRRHRVTAGAPGAVERGRARSSNVEHGRRSSTVEQRRAASPLTAPTLDVTLSRMQKPSPLLTPGQQRARLAAGIPLPRESRKETPQLVAGVVASTCEHCGCTNARAQDSKVRACDYCGKAPSPVR